MPAPGPRCVTSPWTETTHGTRHYVAHINGEVHRLPATRANLRIMEARVAEARRLNRQSKPKLDASVSPGVKSPE